MRAEDQRRVRRSNRPMRLLLLVVLMGGIGFLAGMGIGRLLPDRPESAAPLNWWLGVPLVVVALHLVLLVHELGHLLGGRLAGFRFALLVVGPLKVTREGGRLHVARNRNASIWGGMAASVPMDTRALRQRMLRVVAGGPLASVVLAAVLLLPLPFLPALDTTAQLVLATSGFASLAIAIATMIPMNNNGFVSDGARIRQLLRGGAAAERWCGVAALQGASMSGTRPREWSAALVTQATSLHDGSLDDIGAHLLAYSYALDRGDQPGALAALDHAMSHYACAPQVLQGAMALEAAYAQAYLRNDLPGAHTWLAQGRDASFVEPAARARVEAAVLHAEGRHEEARERAAHGLQVLATGRTMDPGGAMLEADLLRALAA